MVDREPPPTVPARTRVTIDIDHYARSPRLKLMRAYHELKHMGAARVEVAVSSGGLGYHVAAWFDALLDDDQTEALRRTYGDDPNRIHLDVERGKAGHTTEVFWSTKADRDGVRQVFDDPEAAIAYVEMTRKSDHARARALQLYGHKAVQDAVLPRPSNTDES